MAVRNPPISDVLRRRMFMTGPQYTRNDPVGIVNSSSQLRQAVLRNRPQTGNPFIDQGLVKPLKAQFMPDESDPTQGAGGQAVTPDVNPVVPATPDVTDTNVVANISPTTANVPTPKSRPEVTPPEPEVAETQLTGLSLNTMLESLKSNKTATEFINENKELLEKYAPLPEKRNLNKDYLTKFFLDMAARGAQGDGLLQAAATAAPGTFDEYLAATEKQQTKQSERDLLALTMGIQDKKAQDAANQAINLKILDLQKRPDKLRILDGLVADAMSEVDPSDPEYAVKQAKAYDEAMSQVFPDARPGATEMQIAALEGLGHSRGIAAMLLNAQLLKDNVNTPSYFLNYLTIPEVAGNKRDSDFLMGQAERAGASIQDIVAALAQAGYTLNAQGQVVPKAG